MGNFRGERPGGGRGDKRFGGSRGGFGGGRSFGGGRGRDRNIDRPEMHKAVCDECGDSCEVPFRPTGDKPVYCSNCFKSKGGDSRDSGGRRDSRPSFGEKQMFSATCDECGDMCEVPFRPTSGKPVYCSNCFDSKGSSKGGNSRGNNNDGQLKEQLIALNAKLDKLMSALMPKTTKEAVVKEAPVKKEVAVKAVKEAKPKKVAVKKAASKKKK